MSTPNSFRRRASFGRRALPLALFTALASALTGCGTKVQNALKVQETLQECLRHAQVDTNDKQARSWADRAIAVAPNDRTTYFGDPEANPAVPQLSVVAIFGEGLIGDDPALADYMTQAVQKFPDDERGYQFLIEADTRLGRDADRQARAKALIPRLNAKIHKPGATSVTNLQTLTMGLAQAYWDSGDAVNGAATYQKAITAYPNFPGPLNNLAYAYAVSNTHLPEALTFAQKAIALARKGNSSEEEIAGYQDTLGWVQYRQGHLAEAEATLQQAASALPRLPEVRYHLGMVYAAEGKIDAARAELGHAILISQGYAAAAATLESLPKPASP